MMAKILRKILIGAMLVFQPVLAGSVPFANRASVGKLSGERSAREAILQLSESESPNYQAALENLLAAPRAQILALLREDLAEAPQIRRPTMSAVVALHARELLPELKAVAQHTEFWWFFASLNALATGDEELERELAPVYLARLTSLLSTTAKLAVINGLASFHAGLPEPVFNELLASESYELRIAAVRHWRATRDLLSEAERRRRLEKLVELQPRQARVIAFSEVPLLPASERAQLKKTLSKERCERESDSATREACRKAEKSLGGKP